MPNKTITETKEQKLNSTLTYLKSSIEKLHPKVQVILRSWIHTWSKLLRYENSFISSNLGHFKRGEVIYVDFGFNVGNEFGGIHYAIVVEKSNSARDRKIVVIPLTSLDTHERIDNIHHTEVFLGKVIPWTNKNSVAMPMAIRSISKMRIIKPIKKTDKRTKISNTHLTLIDEKIKNYFVKL